MVSLLATVLMLVSVPAQAWAEEECEHSVRKLLSKDESTVGGYQHSYTGHDGMTRGCGVTIISFNNRYECLVCGSEIVANGTYEVHETNHQ